MAEKLTPDGIREQGNTWTHDCPVLGPGTVMVQGPFTRLKCARCGLVRAKEHLPQAQPEDSEPDEKLTPREEFEQMFGSIIDE